MQNEEEFSSLKEEKQLRIKQFTRRMGSFPLLAHRDRSDYINLKTNYLLNNLVSLIIYIVSFIVFYFIKKHSIIFESNYFQFFKFFSISLIVGAVLSNKFILTRQHELWQTFRKLCISLILSLGFLSIILLLFNIPKISRGVLIGTMFSGLVIESLYYYMISEKRWRINLSKKLKISFNYFVLDGIVLSFCCFLILQNLKSIYLTEKTIILFATIYISWLSSAATTHKFHIDKIAKSKWQAFSLQMKFYMLIISLVLLSILLLELKSPDWIYFVNGVALYSFLSGLLVLFVFAKKIQNKTDESVTLFLKPYELKEPDTKNIQEQESAKYSFDGNKSSESTVKHKLQFEYLKDYSHVFIFIDRKLDLKSFDTRKTLIIRSADPFNISVLQSNTHQMIINLHVLNDQIRLNDYLSNINEKLLSGGIFVGKFITYRERYIRLQIKYPFFIANLLYLFDFIWNRAFPKLPLARTIYSTLSSGKNRAISLAECLGRLVYNGFEIIDLTEIDNSLYFVIRKIKESNPDKNIYYSPIFKMKRIGEGGKIIYVYKLRTMHPYSELIQNFLYIHNKVKEGGKFKDDFRIPGWGRLLRSTFVDEIPMIYNLLKGELKLVGVRAISNQYLSLYSEEHQERRKKFKPGLVPPYYADMPKTLEDIELSEKRYFDLYQKNPIKTDIYYFFKALINIIFKEKRSS